MRNETHEFIVQTIKNYIQDLVNGLVAPTGVATANLNTVAETIIKHVAAFNQDEPLPAPIRMVCVEVLPSDAAYQHVMRALHGPVAPTTGPVAPTGPKS